MTSSRPICGSPRPQLAAPTGGRERRYQVVPTITDRALCPRVTTCREVVCSAVLLFGPDRQLARPGLPRYASTQLVGTRNQRARVAVPAVPASTATTCTIRYLEVPLVGTFQFVQYRAYMCRMCTPHDCTTNCRVRRRALESAVPQDGHRLIQHSFTFFYLHASLDSRASLHPADSSLPRQQTPPATRLPAIISPASGFSNFV